MITKIPFMDKIYSRDDKEYYVYVPGTTHYTSDTFGNPKYVYDYYFLDSEFNKFIGEFDSDRVDKVATELIKSGRDVVVGECAPSEDPKPSKKGIWERPTEKQLEKYQEILKEQKGKQVKKLA